ncbi:MAG: SDR family NAD(P)-dependent oxidoreductase [Rhodobacterales bacterium]|nr:SDR family NAD(P)-dependent oxidoreductase [Rhodobacterales bacterium]
MTRTAFITGGSSGIGLAIARALTTRHPEIRLALFARDASRLATAAADLRVAAPKADIRVFAVDLSEDDPAKAAIGAAVQGLGPPDILILSAGMTYPGRWENVSMTTHRAVMEINFFACLSAIAQLAPLMVAGSAIGLIGSAVSLAGTHGYAGYTPSKCALHGLGETLCIELQPRGITVTLCLPPDTDTPMLAAEQRLRPVVTRRTAAGAPVLAPEMVAKAMLRGIVCSVPGFPRCFADVRWP